MASSTTRAPLLGLLSTWVVLVAARADAGDLAISEIMASNQTVLADEDGDFSDWIELLNTGSAACDTRGYFLTDSLGDLRKWELPSILLDPGEHLVIFASEKNRRNPLRELHTNFRMDLAGELLVLIAPDGSTPVSGFAPAFPPQVADASYGISTSSTVESLVAADTPYRYQVPANGAAALSWTQVSFADGAWQSGSGGIGFERASGYESVIDTDVEASIYGINSSAYLRIPFQAGGPSSADRLVLRARYDDGFAAFLNGTLVASANSPATGSLSWDSRATASHADSAALVFAEFDISAHIPLLRNGSNVLAVQALNFSPTSSDFLFEAALDAVVVGEIDTETFLYFESPTPGTPNGAGFAAVSTDPSFSHASGTYTAEFSVTLSVPAGGEIRYTLDGSRPGRTSPLYSAPIRISGTTTVTVRSFQDGKLPGRVLDRTYVLLHSSAANFNSNLPIVIVDTGGRAVGQNAFTPAIFEFIDTSSGRARITDPPQFAGNGAIKIRGSSSTGFPKKQYAVEIRDELREDRAVPLLGMPPESDWILYGPYSDKALMRNYLSYDWSNEIGRYAVRSRFVEVYYKEATGRVTSSHYAGVYVFMEKIKRDRNRVDIARLTPSDASEPEISGGYIIKKDRLDPGDRGFTTSSGQVLAYFEPKEQEITPAQATYLRNYMNAFEGALFGPNFRDPELGYRKYIDPGSFIDHHILVELTKNIDGYRLSTFYYKDRGDKLHMGPIWDYNLSLGNANYLNGWVPQGWYYPQLGADAYPYFPRLFQDPDFQQEYIDRWTELRRGAFQTARLLSQIDQVAAFLDESQRRNFTKWPVLGTYVWPNWYIANTYAEEITWMMGWLDARLQWYDSNYIAAPVFSREGGGIEPPVDLRITAPAGTIYYTTNGNDPRLPGGGLDPTAIELGSGSTVELVSTQATSEVRALVPGNGALGLTWTGIGFNDSTWQRSTSGIGVGYERGSGYEASIDLDVGDAMYNLQTSVYVRVRFQVADPSAIAFLTLGMQYDDGFAAYLNGQLVASSNAPGSLSWDSAATAQHDDTSALQYELFSLAGAHEHLVSGTNVLAIHGLNVGAGSSDLLMVPRLEGSSSEDGEPIVLAGPTWVRARARSGTRWSGLSEATFVLNSDVALRVTEIMYHPADPPPGSPYGDEDFAFIEIQNVGSQAVSLTGVAFAEGVRFDFNTGSLAELPPGEYAVVVENRQAFDWYYGPNAALVAGEYEGDLSNGGEAIALLDGRGQLIQRFTYLDTWYPETDGGGYSLHIADSSAPLDSWSEASAWRASALPGGSPGGPDDPDTTPSGWQLPGDANQDRVLDVSDPVRLVRTLFLGEPAALPCGDEVSSGGNRTLLDANGDARVDISDPIYLLAYLFTRGPAPAGGEACIRIQECPTLCTP